VEIIQWVPTRRFGYKDLLFCLFIDITTNGFFTWITRGYEHISKNTEGEKIYIVNDSSKVRCKEITTILGVLESIGVLRFKSLGGSNSQIYIYVNETKNMQMVRDKPHSYQNKLLEMVNTRHNDSVEMLTYLFQSDFSSDEIWNHLENYFLGILPSDLVQTKSSENDSSEENAYVSVRLLIGDSLFNDYSCWREANSIFDNSIITTFDEEGIPLADYYASKLNIGDINIDAQLVWQPRPRTIRHCVEHFNIGERIMENLTNLLYELIKLPRETEWVEFKCNYAKPEEIGEYISALSNSATYHNKSNAYLVWGVEDETHEIVGTSFDFSSTKIGNEELENWLRRLLTDNANFSVHNLDIDGNKVVMLVINSAVYKTVRFKNIDYIRVGSYKKKLKDYAAMEVQLWQKISGAVFTELYAKHELQFTEALNLLDYTQYFDLTGTAAPGSMEQILHYLLEDRIIVKQDNGLYAITNMGAILFAKDLSSFPSLARKSMRIIQYMGKDRMNTVREHVHTKGYASGFEELVTYVEGLLPKREEIEGVFRSEKTTYPSLAIRELIPNAFIHQDLSMTGTSPMIEIFDNRIEITNPGTPLVEVDRFIDNPPKSRNENIAALLRRTYICEERGIGWDRIALSCELFQIPAPKIDVYKDSTKVTMFSHILFRNIPINEKKWTCYLHACLRYVTGEPMTNSSLRERFGLIESGKAATSRLISSAIDEGLIKALNPNTAPRYMSYIPFWA